MEESVKAKAYKEAFVILSYVPKEDLLKIPKKVLEKISDNMDKNYQFNIKPGKDFEKEEIMPETKSLLAFIFKNYWATEEQIKLIEKRNQLNAKLLEEEKRKIYNPDTLFSTRSNSSSNSQPHQSIILVDQKRHNFFRNILKKIKNLIKK